MVTSDIQRVDTRGCCPTVIISVACQNIPGIGNKKVLMLPCYSLVPRPLIQHMYSLQYTESDPRWGWLGLGPRLALLMFWPHHTLPNLPGLPPPFLHTARKETREWKRPRSEDTLISDLAPQFQSQLIRNLRLADGIHRNCTELTCMPNTANFATSLASQSTSSRSGQRLQLLSCRKQSMVESRDSP